MFTLTNTLATDRDLSSHHSRISAISLLPRRNIFNTEGHPQALLVRGRLKQRRISQKRWPFSASCLTVLTVLTLKSWGDSSPDSRSAERGLALTSSTASTSKYFQSLLSRSLQFSRRYDPMLRYSSLRVAKSPSTCDSECLLQ